MPSVPLTSAIFETHPSINDTDTIDDPKRVEYMQSPWKAFLHFREKRQLDQTLDKQVKTLFQERYHIQDPKVFNRIWEMVASKEWSTASVLTPQIIRSIDSSFKANLIYHGHGILSPPTKRSDTDITVQKFVQVLLHGDQIPDSLFSREPLKAIFIKNDPKFMKDFRLELQQELDNLAANLPKTPQEEILWRTFLGNILAFMPFTYPENKETIKIPTLVNGISKQVDYTIDVIPLSFSMFDSPMTALGLTPVSDPDASPLLTYLGTTFPGGDGFAATLLSDFTPNLSVGQAVYEQNQQAIEEWLKGKKDVHVIGTSLGGALSLHTLRHHPDQLSRIDVYNPPGLYSDLWKKKIDTTCQVHIYTQTGDLVSQMGYWPTGENVHLYSMMPNHDGVEENMISSHARAFAGCKEVTIIRQDPVAENKMFFRKFLTVLHRAIGPFVFFPLAFAYFIHSFFSTAYRVSAFCIKRLIHH